MLTIVQAYRQKNKHWPTRAKVVLALLGLLVSQASPIYAFVAHSDAISDTTPVTVNAITAATNAVNVDNNDAHVILNGAVSDNLSGFSSAQVYYTSPSGHQVAEGQMVASTSDSFTMDVTFPRYSEAGIWSPTATFMDMATNVLTLSSQELASKGFTLDVTVSSSTPDTTPPQLTSFTVVDSSTISVVDDQAFVQTDIILPDDLSGIPEDLGYVDITIRYISPSGKQSFSSPFWTIPAPDEYHAVVTLPQHIESGIWQAQLTTVDNAGNTRVYDASDLTALGFSTALTVTSEPDTTPSSVTSMAFHPLQQDYYDSMTFTGGPIFTMEIHTSDDYSGVSAPEITYRSTTSSQVAVVSGWSMYNDSSTERLQFIVNLPKYAAEGDWLPELSLTDLAGNHRIYTYSDLLALGFDMKATVGDNVTDSVDAGDSVTTDTLGTGATVASPVQIAVTSPVAGSVSITSVDTASVGGDFTGYSLFSQQYSISAPVAEPDYPIVLAFTLDSSQVGGVNPNDIVIFRDGTAVGQCIGSNVADPDPCVKSISTAPSGDVTILVNSSHASQWVFGTKESDGAEFTFQGFKKPILASPELNKEKAGSTSTVKFSLGGDFGLDVLAADSPTSQKVDCITLQPKGDETPTVAADKKDLKINGNDYYRYDWKTLKNWDGTCRELKFTFTTGETAVTYFKFK